MRLRFEFEESDLRDMIEGYFKQRGFKVKDLEGVCSKFNQTFPEGLKIEAEIDSSPSSSMEVKGSVESSVEVENKKESEENKVEEPNKSAVPDILTHTDIMNPDKIIADDESTASKEIEDILLRSQELDQG